MKRLAVRVLFLSGIAMVLGAAFVFFAASRPEGPPSIPARFSQSLWQGTVPNLPENPVYAPSNEIRSAARLESAGIWPLSHSWYSYAPRGAAPRHVVVLLHGAGRDGQSMLEMWRSTADRHGLLLVAPNGGPLRFSALGRYVVTSVAREAAAAHGLAEEGLYLFGHSDGAALALVATAAPGQWQAAALHAGFLPADDLPGGAALTPLRLYLGDEDPIFSLGPARSSLQAMADMGHPSELVTIHDHGHWFYAIGPWIAEDSWRWFRSVAP